MNTGIHLNNSPDLRRALATNVPSWMKIRPVQRVFTYLTGQAGEGEIIAERTQGRRVLESVLLFAGGITGGVAGVAFAGPLAVFILPAAWIAAIGGARDLQLTIYHHCAHGNVMSAVWSKWLGRSIDKLLLIERFDSYAAKHAVNHHGRHSVSTNDDPTVTFLLDVVGFEPGLPVGENLRRFHRALVSPRVHGIMLRARLRSQFVEGGVRDRLLAGVYLAGLLAATAASGWWLPVALGWVLPLTIGYQAAQCARLPVEHHWAEFPAPDGKRDVVAHEELTLPVRCAIFPPHEWTAAATAKWARAMAFNALIRTVVLPGDSGPSHHWHHAVARGDWSNHIRAVAQWQAKRRAGGSPDQAEACGYGQALMLSLESFARASVTSLQAPRLRAPRSGA